MPRPLRVRWMGRVIDADGTEHSWVRLDDAPEQEIVNLIVRHSGFVRVTHPDGSANEFAMEGIDDVGPRDSSKQRY